MVCSSSLPDSNIILEAFSQFISLKHLVSFGKDGVTNDTTMSIPVGRVRLKSDMSNVARMQQSILDYSTFKSVVVLSKTECLALNPKALYLCIKKRTCLF